MSSIIPQSFYFVKHFFEGVLFPMEIVKSVIVAALQVSARYAMKTLRIPFTFFAPAKRTLLQPTFDLLDFGFG
jgi:hypothetical protein